ncbi:MAG: SoxR reducing system RseC family protein [Candidatus Magnetoovum sp. WYHC-5]|nr:SoxR reducing system RseC family protein [Candidatus Magnetoovum sp. WYHC-5]
MEELGVVKKTDGVMAVVLVERKSACKECKESFCMVSDDKAEIECINAVGAIVGQRVRVVFKPYTYLKGTLLIYGVPVLMLFVGAVLGEVFLPEFIHDVDVEMLSAVGGFSALALSFLIIKAISNKMEKKKGYQPVIEEIVNEN